MIFQLAFTINLRSAAGVGLSPYSGGWGSLLEPVKTKPYEKDFCIAR